MFLSYNQDPLSEVIIDSKKISSFISQKEANIDPKTVKSFGEEWLKFNSFTPKEIDTVGREYFDIVDDHILNKDCVVLDLGCGSGRWTKFIAPRVKIVEAVDPSNAIFSATKLNENEKNVRVTQASVSNIPFINESFDFVICLGVLHHIPDTQKALYDIVKKIKKEGHILLYLYYDLDNRGKTYKLLFKTSNLFRLFISRMPHVIRRFVCDIIAFFVYLPLITLSKLFAKIFTNQKWIKKMPLYYYINKSINIIRNDALDRFGTPLEQRFSKNDIQFMMEQCGLINIVFSEKEPFWHATGKKK